MDNKDSGQQEIARLQRSAAELVEQRERLGAEVVEPALAAIQAQIALLQAASVVETDQIGVSESGLADGEQIEVGDVENAAAVAIGRNAQAHIVNVYQTAPGKPEMSDVARFSVALNNYLQWVEQRYGRLNLRGIESRDKKTLSLTLDEVYVSLEAILPTEQRNQSVVGDALETTAQHDLTGQVYVSLETVLPDDWSQSKLDTHMTLFVPSRDRELLTINMNELLGLSSRLVITGGPGSGKTTYLQRIAYGLARALRTGDTEPVERHLGITGDLPLPILVPLIEYNHYRNAFGPGADPRKGTLAAFISHYLIREQAALGLPDDFFERLLAVGQSCMVLLDGLDEVADERERILVRSAVEKLAYNQGISYLLVTSRTRAYQHETVLPESFLVCRVRPMSRTQVRAMVLRWCQAAYLSSEVKAAITSLQEAIDLLEQQRLGRKEPRLVDSPLLLTIVAIVHYNERRLPDQRVELYEKCVEVLLSESYRPPSDATFGLVDWGGSVREKRDLLATLAFEMMKAGTPGGRQVSENQLKSWLRPRFERFRGPEEGRRAMEEFITAIRERGSLLDEREGYYSFVHLTFQEFLCAYYLAETVREPDNIIYFLIGKRCLQQSWWREVILLLVGYLGAKSIDSALAFLVRLSSIWGTHTDAVAGAELAGSAFLELDSWEPKTHKKITSQLAGLLTSPMVDCPNELRAQAGRTLGKLGDPRPGAVGSTSEMVDIPAGPFLMGSDRTKDSLAEIDEEPQHVLRLPAYRVGRHLVTVAQYELFVAAKGYELEHYWTEVGWKWRQATLITAPRYWGEARWTLPNQPVVGVSWFEAVAYCSWLSKMAGRPFRLPDEAMWEKAARGSDGNIFPWGNQWQAACLNSEADEVNETTAVGVFPTGASPYGILDCSGNVWEWCSGDGSVAYPYLQRSYEDDLNGSSRFRALRGGAFNDSFQSTRVAYRLRINAAYGNNNIGFRVVEQLTNAAA